MYAPREVLHATGFLPVGIHGAGDRLEIIRGDAFYQSYICHLPRSIIELAQSNRLDFLSAWQLALNGQLSLSFVAVYASLAAFWLFLTVKVLEARRWS